MGSEGPLLAGSFPARCSLDSQLDLLAQIEKLRRDILWTRCSVAALFLCLAVATVANWTRHHARTVEANEFLLKDLAGNVVARLGQSDIDDTCLNLTAKQNVSIANLCVQDGEGASLDPFNVKSQSSATLTPGFYVYEPLHHFQPGLTITDAMRSHFVDIKVGTETKLVMGHGYKDSVSISSRAGEPKIVLFGVNQNPVWSSH
jgi:hypothetical protein